MDPDTSPRTAEARTILAACAAGTLPPNVALLRLAMTSEHPMEVETALAAAISDEPVGAGRLEAALAIWRANPQAFSTVKGVLGPVSHEVSGREVGDGLASWAATFDRLARTAPEGGVALYALGSPDLLRAATDEVIDLLGRWDLLGPQRWACEIGCGIGRFVAALSPRVGHVVGLDLSPAMIERAAERCAGLPNVELGVTDGRDLAGLAADSFDLCLAADVFPYLVQVGGDLADRHVREAARVLRPGGHLVILNYSYRGNDGLDRREVDAMAAAAGFELRRSGTRDLALWDAATFLLRKP